MGPRHFHGSTTLCSLGLPPHVGRGDAAVLRSTRSESFFDLIMKLRAEDKELQEDRSGSQIRFAGHRNRSWRLVSLMASNRRGRKPFR